MLFHQPNGTPRICDAELENASNRRFTTERSKPNDNGPLVSLEHVDVWRRMFPWWIENGNPKVPLPNNRGHLKITQRLGLWQ